MHAPRLLLASVVLVGCGGSAPPAARPPANHDPAPAHVEIAPQLRAAEFNALVADGTLTWLPLQVSDTRWLGSGDAVDGRVLGDADAITVERCFSSVSFVVDADGGVYPLINVTLDAHGLSTAFGIAVASCQLETYQLAAGQTFAHKIEIVDYDEYVRTHQGGDE